jgi:hypothetical protein
LIIACPTIESDDDLDKAGAIAVGVIGLTASEKLLLPAGDSGDSEILADVTSFFSR